jgi:hypothetical protein
MDKLSQASVNYETIESMSVHKLAEQGDFVLPIAILKLLKTKDRNGFRKQ